MLTGKEDIQWVLRECARRSGFLPNAKSTVALLCAMERDGLVRISEIGPLWYITDAGRAALAVPNSAEVARVKAKNLELYRKISELATDAYELTVRAEAAEEKLAALSNGHTE